MENKNFGQKIINWFLTPSSTPAPEENKTPSARGYGELVFSYAFSGEKNLGELGPIKNYTLDYTSLRMRSWQSYLESDISQTVLKKFTLWIIGGGLKLQCEPAIDLLNSEQININTEDFNNVVESRWGVWGKSRMASFSGMANLHKLAKTAHKTATIGGDALVVLRVVDGILKVQLIDGAHVQSPFFGSEYYPENLANGHQLINGIEVNETGEHVAYYVRKKFPAMDYERIPAKINGLIMAYMVYGLEYRIDNNRGMPLIACVLETMKKMERYKEATIGSAEERQKIVYTIEHGTQSTGESPLIKRMAMAHDADAKSEDLPEDINGRKLASEVAASTNKQVFNMPIDSKLSALESKGELYFKDFYSIHIDIVCATIGIPPNVAMSSYNDSFSASRAATKDWEHTIKVNREDFSEQFYQPIYNAFLTIEVLKKKVRAPGYLKAFLINDIWVIGAYTSARFTGPMFPHIDPLKEANAERVKLGKAADHIPLTTVEQSTEILGGGDSDSNIRQFAEELAETKKLGISLPENPIVKKITPEKPDDDEKDD